jgi:hypothetical protein
METDNEYFESLQEEELALLAKNYGDLLTRTTMERLNTRLLESGGAVTNVEYEESY